MIKPIMKDVFFLGQRSEEATKDDVQVVTDLKDTLAAHRDGCVGMAANMIGHKKRIIIVSLGFADLIMINPVILQKTGAYNTEEGCLSLQGTRPATRYKKIRVQYLDESFAKQVREFEGHTAQIIQHECDHLEGIVI